MKALRIELESRIPDRRLEKWAKEARDYLGVSVTGLEEIKVYKVDKNVDLKTLKEVFEDPVLSLLHTAPRAANNPPAYVAEISFRPGVTDNPARAAEEALALTGVQTVVASGSLYYMYGDIDRAGAQKIASGLLANELIQKVEVWSWDEFRALPRFENVTLPKTVISHPPKAEEISLELDDADLEKLSADRLLALSLPEMLHIRDHFRGLKRNPTDVELEILAQSWSEHCKHKIFAATVDFNGEKIESLYKTYIKRATKEIEQERGLTWLISVFSDNAGIVRFDDNVDLCIKVETHNSPSALDPYGGALTGILGVNRDILGAGLGARPVANTDVFCFAPPSMPEKGFEQFMPEGPKAPRRILEGVHKGVEDGGNKSGIPTVNGAFFFDRDFAGKPLVFVGTVGVLPPKLPDGRLSAEKKCSPGDRIMMVGGAIGADGIHGATFSSMEMNENAPATAVQIGDPLTQKRAMDFLLEARDLGLYSAVTDNGAGGLSSSVGEMAQMTNGAELDLALCPVKYPGLSPWELMVSESQERMTVAVPEKHKKAFLDLAARRGVSATDIGRFKDDGKLTVFYKDEKVADMSLAFIHDSLPPLRLKAEWTGPRMRGPWSPTSGIRDVTQPAPAKISDALLHLLASPNITSKEKWVRAYDHEVQAATHLKPFAGASNDGPSDSGVIWLGPHGGAEKNGAAIGCGMAPRLSPHDPYLMAQYAVDEAVRNVVASGGDPDMLCLLDNFCWPDPVESKKNPDGAYKMGQLVRTCQGLYDICKAYGAPLVSGKDSMKNDFRGKDKRGEQINISILPTLMVTAMARVTMGTTPGTAFRVAGDLIYMLGSEGRGLAGSEYASHFGGEGLPAIDMQANLALYRAIYKALQEGLFQSLHDISEGGLLVALAESAVGGRLGATLDLSSSPEALFSEAAGRFVASVSPDKKAAFEKAFPAATALGTVGGDVFAVAGEAIPLQSLVTAWKKGF